jgi:hypothetical protein
MLCGIWLLKKLMMIKKIIRLWILCSCVTPKNFAQQQKSLSKVSIEISSPDNNINVSVLIGTNGRAKYSIRHDGKEIIKNASLGLIREDAVFEKGLQVVTVSPAIVVKDNYQMLNAKKSQLSYLAKKRIITLKNEQGNLMNIVFQVSNDGVAFRYVFPEKSVEVKKITQELTSFHFPEGARAWLQPKTEAQSGWEHSNPSYEAHYMMDIPAGTPSPGKNGWIYPAMFHYKNTWVLITEAALGRTFCGTSLQQDSPDNEYKINFPQEQEKFTNGVLYPQSVLPWQSPWRIIALGSLKTIAESTLGTDLALPAKKMDKAFIKPGKASWSWILLKDNSIVYDVQKKYIDYAADMHWEYCLVDAAWDKKIGYDKIKELSEYALSKKVGLILWYNSAGDWNTVKYTPKDKMLTHESRIKEFALLEQMGIRGVKVDFFAGDGQSMINYYQDILEDAAAFHLLVNFHGATLPRGWQRTYPNLMTTEAIYGYEMITFNQKDADQAASHMVMSAFARNAFDPMDFTPVSLYKIPKINRLTTSVFELATAVIFLSGIQHYVEGPDGMRKMSGDVKAFMQTVPVHWDDVKFIDGYPGKYYVVARRLGKKWYVAGINGDSVAHQISMNLSFIASQKTGSIFLNNKETATVEKGRYDIINNKRNIITIVPNDGFVAVFE